MGLRMGGPVASRTGACKPQAGAAGTNRGDGRRIHTDEMTMTTLIALALLLFQPGTGEAQTGARSTNAQPDVHELLGRAEARYGSLSSLQATFEQTVEVPLLEKSRWGTGTWYQKGSGRFLMRFADPEGDVIVSDGAWVWFYHPSTHPGQVIRSRIDATPAGSGIADLQGRIFADARDKYEAEYIGEEEMDGHFTHQVSLTPIGMSPYLRVRVWIDADSYLVRRFEIAERNETLRDIRLRDLRPDIAIADSLFHFDPPDDVDVFGG
jgi:outer membrane lipoprotein carrier protein